MQTALVEQRRTREQVEDVSVAVHGGQLHQCELTPGPQVDALAVKSDRARFALEDFNHQVVRLQDTLDHARSLQHSCPVP